MNVMKIISLFSIVAVCALGVFSCSNNGDKQPHGAEVVSDTLASTPIGKVSYKDAHQKIDKVELTALFSKAIADFMAEVYQRDKVKFDTLFVSPVWLPNITLPTVINNAAIHQMTRQELNIMYSEKPILTRTTPYITITGLLDNGKAEFTVGTYYPLPTLKYNCYMNYIFNAEKREFILDGSRMEVLIRDKAGKEKNWAVYVQGKQVGDKAYK
jgi:hypothetical protein